MEITFYGHQSWEVGVAETRLLIDPMLTESFGHSESIRFLIDPARQVQVDRMPPPSAVVVTNEHLDHFHLPSLLRLARTHSADVHLSTLMPESCIHALEQESVSVVLHRPDLPFIIGDCEVTFFPGPPSVPIWESRVCSVYVKPAAGEGGVFVQSDTALRDVGGYESIRPYIFIATQNSQIATNAAPGAFDNLLPLPSHNDSNYFGIELFQAVVNDPISVFPEMRYVFFSGSGYRQLPPRAEGFRWTSPADVEEILSALTIATRPISLLPGQSWSDADGRRRDVAWVTRVDLAEMTERLSPALVQPRRERPDAEVASDLRLIGDEFAALAPLLMLSPLGRSLVHVNSYLNSALGPRRFALCLTEGSRTYAWFLNINTARFEAAKDVQLRSVIKDAPAGVATTVSGLADVFRGKLHVWELAVSQMRQWYLGDRYESPVAFLYGALSEQTRPDLAQNLYKELRERY